TAAGVSRVRRPGSRTPTAPRAVRRPLHHDRGDGRAARAHAEGAASPGRPPPAGADASQRPPVRLRPRRAAAHIVAGGERTRNLLITDRGTALTRWGMRPGLTRTDRATLQSRVFGFAPAGPDVTDVVRVAGGSLGTRYAGRQHHALDAGGPTLGS